MPQPSINLYHVPFEELFRLIRQELPGYAYDFTKHVIYLKNKEHEGLGFLRLPLHLAIDEHLTLLDQEGPVLYLSIESGYAAICIMKGKENVYHTTFSAYMTRKKQGFSQVKYLSKKGKSRAGSRVRLAATTEFFEKINTALTELLEAYDVARIALNCNATLVPYLYQSKVPCPFGKKDPRLYKIPVHIPKSNFAGLYGAIKKLMAPRLYYEVNNEAWFEGFR